MKIQTAKTSLQIRNQKWLETSEKALRFSQTDSLLQHLINPFNLVAWEILPFENCDGIYDVAEFLFGQFDQGSNEVKSAICDLIEFAEKDWKESQKKSFCGRGFSLSTRI